MGVRFERGWIGVLVRHCDSRNHLLGQEQGFVNRIPQLLPRRLSKQSPNKIDACSDSEASSSTPVEGDLSGQVKLISKASLLVHRHQEVRSYEGQTLPW
jgi:hypothetical protein